jgi:hypothetical protein
MEYSVLLCGTMQMIPLFFVTGTTLYVTMFVSMRAFWTSSTFIFLTMARVKSKQDIVTYNVVPVTKNSGIICMVPQSKTLYSIRRDSHMSLLNYILQHSNTKCLSGLKINLIIFNPLYYLICIG